MVGVDPTGDLPRPVGRPGLVLARGRFEAVTRRGVSVVAAGASPAIAVAISTAPPRSRCLRGGVRYLQESRNETNARVPLPHTGSDRTARRGT